MARRAYNSVVRQSLHYLARPHSSIPRAPLGGPAAWRGDELARRSDWRVPLSADEIDELDRAIASVERSAKPLAALARADFPLPTLGAKIRAWSEELRGGLGVVVLEGLPVERWTEAQASIFFWSLGLHLGRPGAQNGRGDLLGRVRDEGRAYDDPKVRGYETRAALAFHVDFADVVGLFCLHEAKSGGESRFVSSVSVYNEILRRRPELLERLFSPTLFDARGDAGVDYFSVIPCRYDAGVLRTTYHGDYMRSVQKLAHAPALDPKMRELLDVYDEVASAPGMSIGMEFRAGDVQLLSNHTVLHGRTGWVDHPEPERRRHLLRLWLSLGFEATARGRLARGRELVRIVEGVVAAKLRARRHA